MLMRAPGTATEPGVALPSYEEVTALSERDIPSVSDRMKVDAAIPSQLTPVTQRDLQMIDYDRSHRATLDRQRAERQAKAGFWLGALLVAPLALGAATNIDHKYGAPIIWGTHTAQIEQVVANNYAFDGSGTITLTATGMSAKRDTAVEIARSVQPVVGDSLPNSKLMALELGSRLYMSDILGKFDAMMAENNPGKLVLVLPSAAGKYGLDIAAHSAEHYPGVTLVIILNDVPYDQESAYDLRDNVFLRSLTELMHEQERFAGPGGNVVFDLFSDDTNKKYRDYGCVQYFVQQGSQEWRANCPVEPWRVRQEIARVDRDVLSRDGSPIGLRADLAAAVMDNSVPGNFDTIAANAERPVTIAYIASSDDRIVDVRQSSDMFRAEATARGFSFLLRNVVSTHAGINDFKGAYQPIIQEILENADSAPGAASNFLAVPNAYSQVSPGF